jgi:N4-gp56 family major capsid protein
MANLTPASNNTVTKANAQGANDIGFIPELWSDEIIAAYKQNLVLANLVNKMPMTGKKGDTLHIPKPERGAANAKTAADTVTIQQTANTEVTVTINNHYEYSRLIEDIVEVQALDSLRRFYTDDAGYALAKQIDNDLFAELLNVSNDAGTADGSDATQSHYQINGASDVLIDYDDSTALEAFSDAAFRNMIQRLDDADVPMEGRVLIIPPVIRNTIMGIERYVSSDFVNGRGVNNGQIGQLYGVDVYVTSNAPTVTGTNTSGRVMTMMHKDAFVLAEQMAVRSQTQYKQEFLANLFTADTLYGTKVLREENVLSVVV